jgi:transcriptional regulator with PAS, ATPase and Fis domain
VDGRPRRFIGEIRPIYDHQGRLFAHAETLTDITDNVRLAEREQELFHFKRQKRRSELQTEMIGSGKEMQGVFDTIVRCAEVDSSVLITGETGVGKEVAARAIHSQSHRKDKPFVAVNCGALPETLLESELFGHVKGAFTGAISDRAGLFREANEGTLFLDEVGELDLSMQVKLLRVLQERKVRPVGSDRFYPVDVRIISATNRNLLLCVQEGKFRMDLYYRVAVIPLALPPLRERPQDILRLAGHFIDKHQKKERRNLKTLSLPAQQLLLQYPWPGNIRELENAIEHALAMSRESEISPTCLPLQILYPQTPMPTACPTGPVAGRSGSTQRQERQYRAILEAIANQDGHLGAAARELGLSRVTLWRKMKKYSRAAGPNHTNP